MRVIWNCFKKEVALISLLACNDDKKTFVSLHRSVVLITSEPPSACDCLICVSELGISSGVTGLWTVDTRERLACPQFGKFFFTFLLHGNL